MSHFVLIFRFYGVILFDYFVARVLLITFHKMGTFRVAEYVSVDLSIGQFTFGYCVISSTVVVVGRKL